MTKVAPAESEQKNDVRNETHIPSGLTGLTAREAALRLEAGEGNRPTDGHGRTVGQIVRSNVFTRFNAVLGSLLVVIVALGPAIDGLFGFTLVANALIGIIQEVLAKRTSDRLSVITAVKVRVLRDGQMLNIDIDDVVRGDLVGLQRGGQVVADGTIEACESLEIDESLLTGEADAQSKGIGSSINSGSFVTAGSGWFRAERVGDDSFANALSAQVRDFVPVRSELRAATNSVLRMVTWAIGPIAAALLIGQRLGGESWRQAIFGAATGVVEIVPEGFVLLTSMTLAASVIRLGRLGVLVKELAAVEGLARVDTMCFDKTGTLTEGTPAVDEIVKVGDAPMSHLFGLLSALTIDASNATGVAVQNYVKGKEGSAIRGQVVPFSSLRKWAAITEDPGPQTWIMGAPEVIMDSEAFENGALFAAVAEQTRRGRRVLLLASTNAPPTGDVLPAGLSAAALITLHEQLRRDARKTLAYFADQEVDVKIISGDSPTTVAALATAAGMPGLDDDEDGVVDARNLKTEQELERVIRAARVIGRTSPEQKRAMVVALQASGRTVAMTGDGVNDALAMKAADLGIAMSSGSDATKAVAQLILVDGGFAALPGVVAEGRRVIANVERVAKLFITKTVYAAAIAVLSGIARLPFPFLPRQLTLVSTLTIGFPGFFLALAPGAPRTPPGFMRRVMVFAVPAGLVAAAATFSSYAIALAQDEVSTTQARTVATMVIGLIGFWVVDVLARSLPRWRFLLFGAIFIGGFASAAVPSLRTFWNMEFPPITVTAEAVGFALGAIALIEIGWRIGTGFKNRLYVQDLA